ncbi:DUF6907 domain-containing protein [Actinacidiphila oryziradicis]|uniref:Uncharacterized protein n=1 Tax=Actinacidiphila oryziradicis TaxID=2571141 RepID=A0A4U0ST59_9ACTN|nr:hypothetical protein [Actinacidiphila oryziradicis]TKA13206.1 hypothetical protein FCI23_00215 [Actinacidiphila oryziradicis]
MMSDNRVIGHETQATVNGTAVRAVPFTQAGEQLPRTWTFTNRNTGKPTTFTCMTGCIIDHSDNIARPTFAEDVWCQTPRENVTLPLNTNGHPEEFRVLGSEIRVMPFSATIAERLPHVTIEMIDDHYIEGLDPDGLATVIRTLAERLDSLKDRHAQLVQVRADYQRRQA